jgi:tetratricopeptide (TPR) repeat protein
VGCSANGFIAVAGVFYTNPQKGKSMKSWITGLMLLCAYAAGAQKGTSDIGKGNDYYHTGQFDLAEKHYRAALKKEPANADAAYNLANALYGQKRYQEAVAVLQSINAAPQNTALQAAIHYNTGVNYTKDRDLEKSIESYKAALRIAPDDKDARENLQKALLELKKEKQQQQQKKQQSSMSQSEAQRQLQQLQEKEKQIQERMNRNRSRQGSGMQKDW